MDDDDDASQMQVDQLRNSATRAKRKVTREVIDVSDDDDDDTNVEAKEDARKARCSRPTLPPRFQTMTREMRLDVSGGAGDPRATNAKRPRRAFVNSAPLSFEAYTSHTELHTVALELCTPRTHAELDIDSRYRVNRSQGDDVLKRMRTALESFGMTRTFLQVTMHDLAMNVMGSAIYGEEWNQHRQRILESNNWRDYPPLMAAICARRFGKSTGAGQLAAAAMLSIPSCPVGCFAPTLRQAVAIMETTWVLLTRSALFSEFRVERIRATEIRIVGPDGTERSLIAYPSTHKVRRWGGEGVEVPSRVLFQPPKKGTQKVCMTGGGFFSRILRR